MPAVNFAERQRQEEWQDELRALKAGAEIKQDTPLADVCQRLIDDDLCAVTGRMLDAIKVGRATIIAVTGAEKPVQTVVGRVDCPVCQRGKLFYRRASHNGHICATCSTRGCLRWDE